MNAKKLIEIIIVHTRCRPRLGFKQKMQFSALEPFIKRLYKRLKRTPTPTPVWHFKKKNRLNLEKITLNITLRTSNKVWMALKASTFFLKDMTISWKMDILSAIWENSPVVYHPFVLRSVSNYRNCISYSVRQYYRKIDQERRSELRNICAWYERKSKLVRNYSLK